MSIEPEVTDLNGSPHLPQSLDLSGLPAPVADELRKLVATLRENLGNTSSSAALQEKPEAWVRRLRDWVDRHQARSITIDDSRESIYSSRGE
jgi:hypothetical protein